jgi:hypothetical protein
MFGISSSRIRKGCYTLCAAISFIDAELLGLSCWLLLCRIIQRSRPGGAMRITRAGVHG